MKNRVSIFDTYVVEILHNVKVNQPCKLTDLRKYLNTTSSKINDKVEEMISEGLIEEKRGIKFNTRYLKITTKGEYVLKHIESILKAIESDELNTLQENDHGPSEETKTEATVNE